MLVLVVFNLGVMVIDFLRSFKLYIIKYYRLTKYHLIDKPELIKYEQEYQQEAQARLAEQNT